MVKQFCSVFGCTFIATIYQLKRFPDGTLFGLYFCPKHRHLKLENKMEDYKNPECDEESPDPAYHGPDIQKPYKDFYRR